MRQFTLAMLLVITGCNAAPVSSDTTPQPTTSTSSTTTTLVDTNSSQPTLSGGQLVRLDPLTLEPLPGFAPIPYATDSWNITSEDGSIMINFEWDNVSSRILDTRAFDVLNWIRLSRLQVEPYVGVSVDNGKLYTLTDRGVLASHDLTTGKTEEMVTWPAGRWPWDELHHLEDNRIAALMTSGSGAKDDMVLIYDPATDTTTEIQVGEVVRTNPNSGVFDGDYEIPESDLPGVVWLDHRVLIVHAETLEIIEVDLDTGTVQSRTIDTTTWWGRLIDNWFPAAAAKGPSLGVYSSAAISADGRHLFISGNRTSIEVAENGHFVESNEHLGLTVVDLETWSIVDAPDLELQFVRNDGGMVLGVNTISQQPWEDELYVLDVDSQRIVTAAGPFIVRSGGCQLTGDRGHMVCTEHDGNSTTLLRVVSIDSGETVAERTISSGDYFHPHGVLEDWAPSSP